MARPKLDIDAEQVQKLAALGCKVKEIADYFGCTDDTIINRFSEELDKGRANLKMSLRQMQIKAAQNGNVAMLIWLGKQLLDQVERTQIDISKVPDDVFIAEAQKRLLKNGPNE
jgi:hypothetical protein